MGTFWISSSRVEALQVNLMGTPVLDGVPKVCVLVSTKRPGGIDAILHRRVALGRARKQQAGEGVHAHRLTRNE